VTVYFLIFLVALTLALAMTPAAGRLALRTRIVDHPSGGKLIVEAPLSPEMRAGFQHFGFDEAEADSDPFAGVRRMR